jgi:hypothetical protein
VQHADLLTPLTFAPPVAQSTLSMPPSAHSARADLERLRGASGTAGDASPFRTAMRNIIAACRNSPLALASYCQQGVLPALAAALQQPQVMSSTQLGTCVLEVALCLTQQLIDETKVTDGSGSSYAVGESVMARRLDGQFGEGARVRGQRGRRGRRTRAQPAVGPGGPGHRAACGVAWR